MRRVIGLVLMLLALAVAAYAYRITNAAAPDSTMIVMWIVAVLLAGVGLIVYKGVAVNYSMRDLAVMGIMIGAGGFVKGYWGQGRVIAEALSGPYGAAIYGFGFFFWGILANYIVRKPLVGTITMTLGSFVELLFGNPFGLPVFVFNVWEGFGADVIYILTGHRHLTYTTAVASGIGAGAIGLGYGWVYFGFGNLPPTAYILYILCAVIGGIIAGVLAHQVGTRLEQRAVRQPAQTVFEE